MARGKFITVEGIEGAGKTTQLKIAAEFLQTHGVNVLCTREPGGTPLGEAVRNLLLHDASLAVGAATELLLLFAARAEHLERVITPALNAGTWVLCDRFSDASYAYQGGGRGVAQARITALEDWVQENMRPDLTLLFDVPVEQGLARAKGRNIEDQADRFERETLAFFQRVRAAYLQLAREHPARYRVIDASHPQDTVSVAVRSFLSEFLA